MNIRILIFSVCVSLFTVDADAQEGVLGGIVIDHIPKSSNRFIGSPSLCILPNGDYVASHDEFGPRSSEWDEGITYVFSSKDKGQTWRQISRINGQFWSNLFYSGGYLYIMGTNRHHGNLIIRRSSDGGQTWTIPYDSKHGLLLEGEYHTAPVPVLFYKGRIWRAVEYATGKSNEWGKRYSAMVFSAPIHSDWLKAKNWRTSNHLPFQSQYLHGNFGGWLEGNVVLGRDGRVVDILRVHSPKLRDEYCALVTVSQNGKRVNFDSCHFLKMPGAAKKFTIRYDYTTRRYWSLVNEIPQQPFSGSSDQIRNTLALVSSPDLKTWVIDSVLLQAKDPVHQGFQYADWQFDGSDIVYVSRTAFDDSCGGAANYHDANYMTFHRIKDYAKQIKGGGNVEKK